MYKITQIREAKNLSKAELGRRTGIAHNILCHLESGRVFPYPGWKKKLSEALEVDPEILFQEVGDEKHAEK